MGQDTWTIGRLLAWLPAYFEKVYPAATRLDAEVLLAHVVGKDRLYLYTHYEHPLTKGELATLRGYIERRVAGESVAVILGEKEFMGLPFCVTKDVLVPRPDTEVLVETVLSLRGDEPLRLADIGTGSGAIAVSLLSQRPNWRGVAADISAAALSVAKDNAERNEVLERLELRRGDLLAPLTEPVDVLVSNPPYIPTGAIPTLAAEVRAEPMTALDGGKDGLAFYRRLTAEALTKVVPGGLIAVEIGYEQGRAVSELVRAQDAYTEPQIVLDYGGRQRVVYWEVKA